MIKCVNGVNEKVTYIVKDYYENFINGDIIGEYETLEEAEKACKQFAIDTDNECDLEIETLTERGCII